MEIVHLILCHAGTVAGDARGMLTGFAARTEGWGR